MKYNKVEIGKRIKARRKARKISQERLSKMVGISRSTLIHIEKGDTLPELTPLTKICEILGCRVSYLLGEDDDREEIEGDLAKLKSWSEAKVKHLNRMMEELEDISSAWEDAIKACDRITRKLRGVQNMNIEKFNNEGMVFKTRVNFGASKDTIYLSERELAKIVEDEWDNPFIAYTDHKDIYLKRVDDIQSIYVESESTLTETEYDAMLDTLAEVNSKRIDTIKVISDEIFMEDIIRAALERCSK